MRVLEDLALQVPYIWGITSPEALQAPYIEREKAEQW